MAFVNLKIEIHDDEGKRIHVECRSFTKRAFLNIHEDLIYTEVQSMIGNAVTELKNPSQKKEGSNN